MLVSIHPKNPEPRKIKQVVEALCDGAVIIYPTDTVYGIGCDILQTKAIERICKIKNIQPHKAMLSFLCNDLSHLSEYAKSIDTPLYRFLKQYLPGPYTFIMEASKKVPKLLLTKRDTVGIRVPDHRLTHMLLEELGRPLMSTSLPQSDDLEMMNDPEVIHEQYGHVVDIVIDAGIGGIEPSTIVDCTSWPPEIVRQGKGLIDY